MIKENLEKIRLKNPKDFRALVISAGLYKEYKNEGDSFMEHQMLAVITDILDKHGVKYENDLC